MRRELRKFKRMADRPSRRKQYLRHFKRWHIEKNIKTHEYLAMIRIQNKRLSEGKQTEFTIRKRPVPRDKIESLPEKTR